MSVKIRSYKRGGWEVDIRGELPSGQAYRERRKSPVTSKSGSKRWGEARERELLEELSKPKPQREEDRKEVPTLEEFAPRYMDNYVGANRQKPSTIVTTKSILRTHLVPILGSEKLDAISTEDVQRLKKNLGSRAKKTVNNVLVSLHTLLRVAVDWGVIEEIPCEIKLVRAPRPEAKFHDFEEYLRLLNTAKIHSSAATVSVLLGGDAGLRMGEMLALEWADVDASKGRMSVSRSAWCGFVTEPKGGRTRELPLTARLKQALVVHEHGLGPRVLCQSNGRPLTQKMLRGLVANVASMAKVKHKGIHVLRHTFCSHLAMKGVPARSIQELAGHEDLATTQRYMHLSPAAVEEAIRILEQPKTASGFGDIVETVEVADQNS